MCTVCNSRANTTRRRLGQLFVGGSVGALIGSRDASAQISAVCVFGGGSQAPQRSHFRPASQRAWREVDMVCRAINFTQQLEVVEIPYGNAMAFQDRQGPRVYFVVAYNPRFLSTLDRGGGPYASLSVLAHEVGHHANGDTDWRGSNRHPWDRELGADFVSGLALARLGATDEEAERAIDMMFDEFGSRTHPDSDRRLDAIHAGWVRGGRQRW